MEGEKQDSVPSTYVEGFHDRKAVEKMEYRRLGKTGLRVSLMSLGSGSLGALYGEVDEKEGIRLVHETLRAGVNLIDTAPWYGQGKSETLLGKALKGIPREAYYISTKVARYELNPLQMFDFTYNRTLQSVETSLSRLGLDYVDFIQVHDCEFAPSVDIIVKETLPALQHCVQSGKCKRIGITGYPLSMFKEIIDRATTEIPDIKISVILSYCHYTLLDTSLESMLDYFESKGIGVMNAAPVSMGLLTEQGPPSWHPAAPELKEACVKAAQYCKSQGVDIAKIAVHYSFHNNQRIPTTLVSSPNAEMMKANIETCTNKTLSEKEQSAMNYILKEYFAALPASSRTWEGKEIEALRQKIAEAKLKQAEAKPQ